MRCKPTQDKRSHDRCNSADGAPLKAGRANLSIMQLSRALGSLPEQSVVYSYVVRSISLQAGNFLQCGSAPNFEGDCITLCTCMHHMRAYKTSEDWRSGKFWIAGFTSGTSEFAGRNWLVYLMRVGEAYPSHHELAAALAMGRSSRSPPRQSKIRAASSIPCSESLSQALPA
jgi:hypothetical protein